MPALAVLSIAELGDGSDHIAYEVNSQLVVRLAKNPDLNERSELVRKEAQLLRAVSECSPPSVPEPVLAIEREGALVYRKIAGLPLIDARRSGLPGAASRFGVVIGPFLERLHQLPVEEVSPFVPREQSPVVDWHFEAKRCFELVAGQIPPTYRERASTFLAAPLPPEHFIACLCHNDLGMEHVLVDPNTGEVEGIIDWSDAAITDPARDFGLILRDLGREILDLTIGYYAVSIQDLGAMRDRAFFYARCSLFDDMEYGFQTGREIYVEKSLAAVSWLFPD